MSLFSTKQKNHNTFNPKELNRKQLQQQNLIFIISAIIIIIGLIVVVVYTINFLVGQMDEIFETVKNTDVNLEGFDIKGFNEIKEKLQLGGSEIEKFLEEIEETINQTATTTPKEGFMEGVTSTLENVTTTVTITSSPPSTISATPTTTLTITPSPEGF
ncbi:MAG: hypothetical protein N2692_02035 [Patescibacteria group bacterium]|jgi:predicted PurR-regulated permease PerM|nr:hypothetical protein [Patescibacteria group bacterium]